MQSPIFNKHSRRNGSYRMFMKSTQRNARFRSWSMPVVINQATSMIWLVLKGKGCWSSRLHTLRNGNSAKVTGHNSSFMGREIRHSEWFNWHLMQRIYSRCMLCHRRSHYFKKDWSHQMMALHSRNSIKSSIKF